MGTIYTLITGLSIVGIQIVDIILSIISDCVSFSIAWKIGGIGSNAKSRSLIHWISRISTYAVLVVVTQQIFL